MLVFQKQAKDRSLGSGVDLSSASSATHWLNAPRRSPNIRKHCPFYYCKPPLDSTINQPVHARLFTAGTLKTSKKTQITHSPRPKVKKFRSRERIRSKKKRLSTAAIETVAGQKTMPEFLYLEPSPAMFASAQDYLDEHRAHFMATHPERSTPKKTVRCAVVRPPSRRKATIRECAALRC